MQPRRARCQARIQIGRARRFDQLVRHARLAPLYRIGGQPFGAEQHQVRVARQRFGAHCGGQRQAAGPAQFHVQHRGIVGPAGAGRVDQPLERERATDVVALRMPRGQLLHQRLAAGVLLVDDQHTQAIECVEVMAGRVRVDPVLVEADREPEDRAALLCILDADGAVHQLDDLL